HPALAAVSRQANADRPVVASRVVQATPALATIKGITRTVLPDVVRVVIDVDMEVPFHDERAADAERLLIDFTHTRPSSALSDQTVRLGSDTDVVQQARVAAIQNRSTRLALDATGVATYSIYPLYNPYRLVIDCVRGARPVPLRPLVSRPLLTAWAR